MSLTKMEVAKTCSQTDDVCRLPPEMWEEIFLKLVDPRDFENAAMAVLYWKKIIHNLRTNALFCGVFPLLLEYLSKTDILRCRQVCKSWCYGVDHFLHNNPYHRPVNNEYDTVDCSILYFKTQTFKTDIRLRPLMLALSEKKLMFNYFPPNSEKTRKFLAEAAGYSRCPIVGRSACVIENNNNSGLEFLEQFGSHLWFLRISLSGLVPVTALHRILELIACTPNLKKLEIMGVISFGTVNTNLVPQYNCETAQALRNYMRYQFPVWDYPLPRLETLDIEIVGTTPVVIEILTTSLLHALYHNRLSSLAMNSGTVPRMGSHITDLSLFVFEESQVENLLFNLRAPLKRFILNVGGFVPINKVFRLFSRNQKIKFHGWQRFSWNQGIRSVGLQLSTGFYENIRDPALHHRLSHYSYFWQKRALCSCKSVKRIALKGCSPISFNFLWGLRPTLQYMHIYTDNNSVLLEDLPNLVASALTEEQLLNPELDLNEIFDVKKQLQQLSPTNKLQMYQSNVWEHFPKLKVLTVLKVPDAEGDNNGTTTQPEEWEYRRDTYEKLRDARLVTTNTNEDNDTKIT